MTTDDMSSTYPRKGPIHKTPYSRTTGKPRRYQQVVTVHGGSAGAAFQWVCAEIMRNGKFLLCAQDVTESPEAADSAIRSHLLDRHEGTPDVILPRGERSL